MNVRAAMATLLFVFISNFITTVQATEATTDAKKVNDTHLKENQKKEEIELVGAPVLKEEDIKPEEDYKKAPIRYESGDSIFELITKFKIEGFYSKNVKLLNNNNPTDRVLIPARHTIDFNPIYNYGLKSHGYDVVKFRATIRNKGTWGDPASIASTDFETIKLGDVVAAPHNHAINRHILWFRELWIQFAIRDFLGLSTENSHYFKLGLFPFQLGRGIALGDAYATDPDVLGYYSPNVVDQYAPGFLLSGELVKNRYLTYDIYAAITDNRSDTFDNVNLRTQGQVYGKKCSPARGFGVINYILASRLQWMPFNKEDKRLLFEPYVLYNDQKEQRIEFIGDASSKLGTFGLNVESAYGPFEAGFDVAFNVGRQKVKGSDRNTIIFNNRTGILTQVNSEVIATVTNAATNDVAGKQAVFTSATSANQTAINNVPEDSLQNGQMIVGTTLKNSPIRFTNPYTNRYRGSMMVFDMSYWVRHGTLRLAVAGGYASGDQDPNKDHESIGDSDVDGDYRGFISLQEIYSGTRVKSAFLLSGAGRIPRLLDIPSRSVQLGQPFSSMVSRFTNIVFVGGGVLYRPKICGRSWHINPNILTYWQDHASRRFDLEAVQFSTAQFARKHLGTEFNIFVDTTLLEDLKFFMVGAFFIPGSHYKDVKGVPLSRAQQLYLDQVDRTGFSGEIVPVLGYDPAYFFNMGLEYKF